MRKLFSVIAAAAILAVPGQADAQVSLGPTVAWHDEADFGIGVMADIPLPALAPGAGILADLTFFFPDQEDVNFLEINGNLKWEFPGSGEMPVVPFALGGINWARTSVDDTDFSDSEVGLNLGGGIRFNAGNFRPIVGIRVEIDGGEGFVIFGTLPFSLGG